MEQELAFGMLSISANLQKMELRRLEMKNTKKPLYQSGSVEKLPNDDTPTKKKKHGTMSAVQRACTRYILENPDCNRWELGEAIGRGYAPDVVQYLRRKGIEVITDMRKVAFKKVPIGFYTIHPESRAKAWQMIGGCK